MKIYVAALMVRCWYPLGWKDHIQGIFLTYYPTITSKVQAGQGVTRFQKSSLQVISSVAISTSLSISSNGRDLYVAVFLFSGNDIPGTLVCS